MTTNQHESHATAEASADARALIPIDWRRVHACATQGRRFKSRTDAAVKMACPQATAIWRLRVIAPLDWRDWLFNIASTVTDLPWCVVVEAIDCIRLELFPDALYLVEQDSRVMLALIARKGARLTPLTGPDLAGEYHDRSRTFAKDYRVK